MIGEIESSECH